MAEFHKRGSHHRIITASIIVVAVLFLVLNIPTTNNVLIPENSDVQSAYQIVRPLLPENSVEQHTFLSVPPSGSIFVAKIKEGTSIPFLTSGIIREASILGDGSINIIQEGSGTGLLYHYRVVAIPTELLEIRDLKGSYVEAGRHLATMYDGVFGEPSKSALHGMSFSFGIDPGDGTQMDVSGWFTYV